MTPIKNIIKRFELNTQGRDFVMGDIHGAFPLAIEALQAVNYNIETDRLFIPGDLVDRGQYSAQVREFLAIPGVHAARGNHEDMFLELFHDGLDALKWQGQFDAQQEEKCQRNNGMGWIAKTSDEELIAIATVLEELPLLMEIDSVRGKVGIVHADIPLGVSWSEFVSACENRHPHTLKTALWGRTRVDFEVTTGVDGIDRVYVGHTIKPGATRLGNVWAIDTGATFAITDEVENMALVKAGTPSPYKQTLLGLTATTGYVAGEPKAEFYPAPGIHIIDPDGIANHRAFSR